MICGLCGKHFKGPPGLLMCEDCRPGAESAYRAIFGETVLERAVRESQERQMQNKKTAATRRPRRREECW